MALLKVDCDWLTAMLEVKNMRGLLYFEGGLDGTVSSERDLDVQSITDQKDSVKDSSDWSNPFTSKLFEELSQKSHWVYVIASRENNSKKKKTCCCVVIFLSVFIYHNTFKEEKKRLQMNAKAINAHLSFLREVNRGYTLKTLG